MHLNDFNSIKVQLELKFINQHPLAQKFQFHKGTIRTDSSQTGNHVSKNFNSIKVQLELLKLLPIRFSMRHFNSIKVQLEQNIRSLLRDLDEFQFHKGTIRTYASKRFCWLCSISIP